MDFASTDLGEKEIGELYYMPGTSRRLAYVAETSADTLNWLKDKHRTMFCIILLTLRARLCYLGLRLADKSLVWLFLHVRLDGEAEELVAEAELQDMLKALQPENLFNDLVSLP